MYYCALHKQQLRMRAIEHGKVKKSFMNLPDKSKGPRDTKVHGFVTELTFLIATY